MASRGPWELDLLGARYTIRPNDSEAGPRTQRITHLAGTFISDLRSTDSPWALSVCEEICAHLVGGWSRLEQANRRGRDRAEELVAFVEWALRSGLLTLSVEPLSAPTFDVPEPSVDLGDLVEDEPPPPDNTTWLELTIVDEVGEAIGGLDVVVFCDGEHRTETTSGAGTVRVDGLETSFGTATVANIDQLREIVEPRWESTRQGAPPQGESVTVEPLRDDIAAVKLQRETPHTLVITPRLGKLFVELYDKAGRTRHAQRSYEIRGPETFKGVTDDDGRLLHTDVPMGDYTLTLTLSGDDFSDDYTASLVVLDPDDATPQIRMIGALPQVVMARVRGMVFETNKTFLLPLAMPSLQRIRDVYEENDPGELLVVGHTDTSGEPSINDPLSVERAKSVAAYLRDDVDTWLKNYDQGPASRRWGDNEDVMMIQAVTAFDDKPSTQNSVAWFQTQHNQRVELEESDRPKLDVDGLSGPKTRRELITDYMMLDGTSVAADDEDAESFDIEITEHGCGENFPLDSTGEQLDQAAIDGQDDAQDRRVELFFFDREFGIQPPPGGTNSGAGSTQYPTWRQRAARNDDLWVGPHILEGRMTYLDGSPAAGVAFVVRAGEQAVDGGYTNEDGRYRLTVFSERAEIALVDKFPIGRTVEDDGEELVAVAAVPDVQGAAVA